MILAAVFEGASAQDSLRTLPDSITVYLTMRKGKLIEFNHGKQRVVKKDIVLTDETTIYPNGHMDMGSGQSHRLHRGQYLTMDGKIRRFQKMPKPVAAGG